MANRKYLKSLVALAICFSMALLPVMQTVSAQPISASEAAQQQLNAIMPSVNALNLEISSNLNTYAQQLSTNVAFTTTPAMDSVTPASQGATYFSIGVGGTSLYDGVITLGSVTGGIWSANGTFLYVYEAWIDPSSLQIVNVTVYLYSSLEPSAPPSLSASNVYTIGEPNASVLQATIGSSTAQVTPLASGCGYYGNWSGYCVEGPSNSETYIAEAYMQTNVIFPNTGNYGYYSYMGVASWDGLAELGNGQPILYQGGWQILGTEVGGNGEYWDYNAVIENYPGPELYASWSPHAGDIITATTVFNDDNDQVTVSVTDGGNQFVRTYSNSGYPTLFWAQYIVEDPSTNNQPNRLIGWSGDINQTNIDTTYGWNGGTTEAALSYYLTANFCSYEQWYMTPWEMGQTLDASTTFYSTANTLSTVYLTSY